MNPSRHQRAVMALFAASLLVSVPVIVEATELHDPAKAETTATGDEAKKTVSDENDGSDSSTAAPAEARPSATLKLPFNRLRSGEYLLTKREPLFAGGSARAALQQGAQAGGAPAQNGTDPRDFANKFMPYYNYTELDNGLYTHSFTMFGLFRLADGIAMTYEVPLFSGMDITDTDVCSGLPNIPCFGGIPPGGGLPSGLVGEGDGRALGIGDSNIRFMVAGPNALGGGWIFGAQFDLPSATDPVMASESFNIGPFFAYVTDLGFWPGPGAFFASMNFFFFDAFKDVGRPEVNRWVGRWFFMLPLHPSGIYLLPELQPVFDFESEHFSFWFAPEIGKMLKPGQIIYVKPGWGVQPEDNSADRKFTLEVGYRWFL